ncbi:MAG TPA: transcription termination/antitermination protein NusA [Blastocatellia bacterium]|jgi:N utilization substance protein A|nr:transcription termination/antitermination protein NusA [Blastocatellia bacterium]HAF25123.1 transcription termination/antitermination protein NusA [Blastocatellia bacterium]HCX28375.1 transcription termination/antitermination protein NusA [Blastocatellia bacterium]
MSSSIAQNIEALCQEQGIERDLVIDAMKEAVRAAAKKQFRSGEDIQVDWNPETGIELSATKVVVDEVANSATELSIDEARELAGEEVELGDALLLPLPMEELGRIAAQTAKQILFQKVRDAVRSNVYEQYIDKIGDLVNGYVKRFERGNIIVDLGNLEAILPRSQQSRGEQWNQGERIRVVINNVSKESKGPQVEVSRTSPELLLRLFEMEVPEIYDGTVVIKSAVREPGERAKIAVTSNERDVDPVGACVGMKGSRVQAIIRELRGEKIDIIEWSDEPSVFAANALSPAKVNQVRITDIENRQMEVIVNEDQLSLAIGKRGQNVRLATKLVGWNIDIRSEEEIKREVTEQMGALIASGESVPLSAIEGVTGQQADALAEHGINDIDALAQTSVDDLVEFLDLSLDEAETILNAAVAVVAMRNQTPQGEGEEGGGETEPVETSAESEVGETAGVAETETVEGSNDETAAGYDEAVETGLPYRAEPEILAQESADPVALTEAEPFTEDEIILQEVGRDLRPDTVVPSPDMTSSGAAALENLEEFVTNEDIASEELTDEAEKSAPAVLEDAASSESTDEEKQDASPDAAN